jgi:hypothetical protein
VSASGQQSKVQRGKTSSWTRLQCKDMRRTVTKGLTESQEQEHGEESDPEHRVATLVVARHDEIPNCIPENVSIHQVRSNACRRPRRPRSVLRDGRE